MLLNKCLLEGGDLVKQGGVASTGNTIAGGGNMFEGGYKAGWGTTRGSREQDNFSRSVIEEFGVSWDGSSGVLVEKDGLVLLIEN